MVLLPEASTPVVLAPVGAVISAGVTVSDAVLLLFTVEKTSGVLAEKVGFAVISDAGASVSIGGETVDVPGGDGE